MLISVTVFVPRLQLPGRTDLWTCPQSQRKPAGRGSVRPALRLYPTGTCVHGAQGTRWDSALALRQSQHIRALVLSHQRLMARAPIQLYELNSRTLAVVRVMLWIVLW